MQVLAGWACACAVHATANPARKTHAAKRISLSFVLAGWKDYRVPKLNSSNQDSFPLFFGC
jgi:hypothetical protein